MLLMDLSIFCNQYNASVILAAIGFLFWFIMNYIGKMEIHHCSVLFTL